MSILLKILLSDSCYMIVSTDRTSFLVWAHLSFLGIFVSISLVSSLSVMYMFLFLTSGFAMVLFALIEMSSGIGVSGWSKQ